MKNSSALAKDIFKYGKVDDCPIYDMHGHMGTIFKQRMITCTAEKIAKAAKEANVTKYVFSHVGSLMASVGNAISVREARKFPKLMRAYCGINPNLPKATEKDLADYDNAKDVWVGLKMLSDYHKKPLTDPGYKTSWEFANKRKLLVLLHTWGKSKMNGPENVEEMAKKYPDCKIIMGHSCHGEWDKAIRLVNKYKNVYFDLCAVLDERGPLEKFIEGAGSKKMVFGTDMPEFSFHYYIGAVLGATQKEEEIRNIFYRNAQKLLV